MGFWPKSPTSLTDESPTVVGMGVPQAFGHSLPTSLTDESLVYQPIRLTVGDSSVRLVGDSLWPKACTTYGR